MKRTALLPCLLAALVFAGCESMQSISKMGGEAAAGTGLISRDQQESLDRTTKAAGQLRQDFTPEEEYYIGRAVGASVVSRYGVYEDRAGTRYLNVLGQTLAQFSDQPETFAGYHFLIIDTDEINAFAAPGGFIFVSKGLIRCCTSEDELAAVLAHEIGHVQNRDGIKAISSGRRMEALKILSAEGAKALGVEARGELAQLLSGSVEDITTTLWEKGYSRSQERGADEAALVVLHRTGYDPHALVRMLHQMDKRLKPGGTDFFKTHPKPTSRIDRIKDRLESMPKISVPAVRVKRFQAAFGKL